MEFTLLWIDLFPKDRLFGFGVFSIKNYGALNRNLLSIYWNNGELLIDLLWFRVH